MARSHRRPPIRDAFGFRRLPDHGAALAPAELRALLDPQPGDAPDRVLASLTRVQQQALASLDSIAHRLPLIARARMLPACHPDLAFACGLDHAAPPARLGALLARAYARADRYAEACAEEIEVRAEALGLANALSAALAALAGPGGVLWFKNRPGTRLADESAAQRGLRAFERMRWDADAVRAGRCEDLTAGLRVIEQMRASLDDLATDPPALGWPSSDEARFFFLLRLAELFAVSTGVVPTFNGARPKFDPHAAWTDFAWAALDISGLGRANFDALSRRLGGRRVGSEVAPRYAPTAVEARYGGDLECLATAFTGAAPAHSLSYRHRLTIGALPSVGRAADRQNNDPEPEDWVDAIFFENVAHV